MQTDEPSAVAVLTGAAGQVGQATAQLFAARGYRLVLADLDRTGLSDLHSRIGQNDKTVTRVTDITASEDVRGLAEVVSQRMGRVDVLVNLAGIWPRAPLASTDDAMWNRVLSVNLTGPFFCCRTFLPLLMQSDGGAIINVASGAATRPHRDLGAYCASKSGLVGLSRVLALEGAPRVRVNVVAPGRIARDLNSELSQPARPPADIPLERSATPDEIANAIVFLASTEAAYITGQTLHVNGGRYMP
jgi:NAD(P)-dependent dehydrogenase (short-subunit alcohol dehydrogenase family)